MPGASMWVPGTVWGLGLQDLTMYLGSTTPLARKSAILRSVGFVPNQYVKSSVDEVVGEGRTGRRNFFK